MYDVPDLHGKLAIVTGSNSGTGKEAAKRLAGAGARVIMAVRTPSKGEPVRDEILERLRMRDAVQVVRGFDRPNLRLEVEAFQDDAAAAHVNSDHFKKFVAWAPDYVDESPQIINTAIPGTDWSRMGEVTPR